MGSESMFCKQKLSEKIENNSKTWRGVVGSAELISTQDGSNCGKKITKKGGWARQR